MDTISALVGRRCVPLLLLAASATAILPIPIPIQPYRPYEDGSSIRNGTVSTFQLPPSTVVPDSATAILAPPTGERGLGQRDGVAVSADGGTALVATRDGTAAVYERTTSALMRSSVWQHTQTLGYPERFQQVTTALSDDGRVALVGSPSHGQVYERDEQGKFQATAELPLGFVVTPFMYWGPLVAISGALPHMYAVLAMRRETNVLVYQRLDNGAWVVTANLTGTQHIYIQQLQLSVRTDARNASLSSPVLLLTESEAAHEYVRRANGSWLRASRVDLGPDRSYPQYPWRLKGAAYACGGSCLFISSYYDAPCESDMGDTVDHTISQSMLHVYARAHGEDAWTPTQQLIFGSFGDYGDSLRVVASRDGSVVALGQPFQMDRRRRMTGDPPARLPDCNSWDNARIYVLQRLKASDPGSTMYLTAVLEPRYPVDTTSDNFGASFALTDDGRTLVLCGQLEGRNDDGSFDRCFVRSVSAPSDGRPDWYPPSAQLRQQPRDFSGAVIGVIGVIILAFAVRRLHSRR